MITLTIFVVLLGLFIWALDDIIYENATHLYVRYYEAPRPEHMRYWHLLMHGQDIPGMLRWRIFGFTTCAIILAGLISATAGWFTPNIWICYEWRTW